MHSGRSKLLEKVGRIVLSEQLAGSGRHIDPLEVAPPSRSHWEAEHGMSWDSREMAAFRDCLRLGALDVRRSALDDLAAYHKLPPETCREICIDWERRSLEEWRSADRSTAEGVVEFYDVAVSWVFDLMWYAYLQSEGFGLASSVIAARSASRQLGTGDHLDFGSGVGVTSQLFRRLGFRSTSADISKPLLEFARWRCERRGEALDTINLRYERLPGSAYDVVTAIDTLVHVPNFDATAQDLHRALRPGGLLITNFDVRKKGEEITAWHLYDSVVDLDDRLCRAGFKKESSLSPVTHCYRRVEADRVSHRLRGAARRVSAPARKLSATLHRVRWPTRSRLKKLFGVATHP